MVKCPYYAKGFCNEIVKAKNCRYGTHISSEICVNYTLGFCPDGPKCNFVHIKEMISQDQDFLNYLFKLRESETLIDFKNNIPSVSVPYYFPPNITN